AGDITGRTLNGAALIYAGDPNMVFRPPAGLDHFVTFGSAAYARNAPARFHPAGTVAEQTIQFDGGYDPPTAVPRFRANEINVAYSTFPGGFGSPDLPFGRDGYVLRIALDVSQVQLPGGMEPGNYRLFDPAQVPFGYQPVFLSQPVSPGTMWGMQFYG